MNKVVTINLNGRAYSIEEKGYDALRAYLDGAAAELSGNPDKDEIMADFEQAIAQKCDALFAPGKNVVSDAEIEEIIKKMGPVAGGAGNVNPSGDENAGAERGEAASNSGGQHKRFYRLYEGERFKGVCTGIAAYFGLDVILVRALFVLLTIFSGGGWAILYIVLAVIMPVAVTSDEIAQAHGTAPFTARDFIDHAKLEYEKFATRPSDRRRWHREWHAKVREATRRRHREHNDNQYNNDALAIFGGIILALLWFVLIYAVISFILRGAAFGVALGMGQPIWITLLFFVGAFWIVSLPFRWMMRESGWRNGQYYSYRHGGFGGGIWSIGMLILVFYLAGHLFAPVHIWWNTAVHYLQTVR